MQYVYITVSKSHSQHTQTFVVLFCFTILLFIPANAWDLGNGTELIWNNSEYEKQREGI